MLTATCSNCSARVEVPPEAAEVVCPHCDARTPIPFELRELRAIDAAHDQTELHRKLRWVPFLVIALAGLVVIALATRSFVAAGDDGRTRPARIQR